MEINRIDHIVLTVRDLAATCAFYRRVLGMAVRREPERPVSLNFGGQKINLHAAGAEFSPRAALPTPGSADICLITDVDIDRVVAHLNSEGVEIEVGPVPRTGATGPIRSVYFRDPDQNLVEVSNYLVAGG